MNCNYSAWQKKLIT